MTFDGVDLYPTIPDKAAALGFSLACNHGYEDGNKRIGHAALELFLVLNGYEIDASIDEQETLFLRLADGQISRDSLSAWVAAHMIPFRTGPSGDSSDAP
jgi:death-on-curing protein